MKEPLTLSGPSGLGASSASSRSKRRSGREQRVDVKRPAVKRSGLLSPADQWCIEIDVTNACPHECANCTRFTRLVTKPFRMDLATFRRAVDSMTGYRGVLGIMGGEPTLHPQFGEMLEYYREHWHAEEEGRKERGEGREVIEDFGAYAAARAVDPKGTSRRVLFTSLGPGYYRHFEAIQDAFTQQGINTHQNGSLHQALLVTRRELGIPDPEWLALRDNCWVQRLWSGSITPKGAYFCEIAGALDMLYDGIPDARRAELGMPSSGGWPIERGWWRRTPVEFGEQLGWCELCGAGLPTPCALSTENVQQVSPWHAARLAEIGSPLAGSPRMVVLEKKGEGRRERGDCVGDSLPSPFSQLPSPNSPLPSSLSDPDWYMPARDKPQRAAGHDLHPRHIEAITVSVDCGEELRRTLPGRVRQVDRYIVVTATHDALTQRVAREAGAVVVVTDACYDDHASFNKGAMLNAGLRALKLGDWVVLSDADIFFPPEWREHIARLVLNPGCLYYTRRWHLPQDAEEPDWNLVTDRHLLDPGGNDRPWGYFQLWNVRASCLKSRGGVGEMPADTETRRHGDTEMGGIVARSPGSLSPLLPLSPSPCIPLRFPLCFCSAGTVDHWFCLQWPKEKTIRLPAGDHRFDMLHLWHGPLAGRWNGRRARPGQWQYAGQSDIAVEERWQAKWPAPCLVRRVDVRACCEETRYYDGRPIVWSTPTQPGVLYEFSTREE